MEWGDGACGSSVGSVVRGWWGGDGVTHRGMMVTHVV